MKNKLKTLFQFGNHNEICMCLTMELCESNSSSTRQSVLKHKMIMLTVTIATLIPSVTNDHGCS